jgi:hypothetical protein
MKDNQQLVNNAVLDSYQPPRTEDPLRQGLVLLCRHFGFTVSIA